MHTQQISFCISVQYKYIAQQISIGTYTAEQTGLSAALSETPKTSFYKEEAILEKLAI